jgi:hypothetical protein
MKDTIQKFINDTTDFVLNHHEEDNFPDILVSIGDYRLEVPNNADTFTKLVCYLHDIKQDVD